MRFQNKQFHPNFRNIKEKRRLACIFCKLCCDQLVNVHIGSKKRDKSPDPSEKIFRHNLNAVSTPFRSISLLSGHVLGLPKSPVMRLVDYACLNRCGHSFHYRCLIYEIYNMNDVGGQYISILKCILW